MAVIETNLSSPVTYNAREELPITVTFTVPQNGIYYLIGGLYTVNYEYIAGSMFGIILPTGAAYYINSAAETQLWEATTGEIKELTCGLTLTMTNVVLSLFLMRMTGSVPSLTDDVEEGSVALVLTSEDTPVSFNLSALVSALVVVGMMGIAMKGMTN